MATLNFKRRRVHDLLHLCGWIFTRGGPHSRNVGTMGEDAIGVVHLQAFQGRVRTLDDVFSGKACAVGVQRASAKKDLAGRISRARP